MLKDKLSENFFIFSPKNVKKDLTKVCFMSKITIDILNLLEDAMFNVSSTQTPTSCLAIHALTGTIRQK
jgi:hypothetical protein